MVEIKSMSKCNHFHDFTVDFLVTENVSSDSPASNLHKPWILQASLPLAPLVSSLLTDLHTRQIQIPAKSATVTFMQLPLRK